MIKVEYRTLIEAAAKKYDLGANLIEAICMQESTGNPLAVKFEPGFYEKYTKPMKFSDTEEICRAISWGLMQIMGEVARELGFKGKFLSELCDNPELAIEYGCQHLKHKLNKYGFEAGIAAYNAGSPTYVKGGKFSNQDYVDGVLEYLSAIKKERNE